MPSIAEYVYKRFSANPPFTASEIYRQICSQYGEKTVSYATVLRLYGSFKRGETYQLRNSLQLPDLPETTQLEDYSNLEASLPPEGVAIKEEAEDEQLPAHVDLASYIVQVCFKEEGEAMREAVQQPKIAPTPSGSRTYRCSLCSATYRSALKLNQHLAYDHHETVAQPTKETTQTNVHVDASEPQSPAGNVTIKEEIEDETEATGDGRSSLKQVHIKDEEEESVETVLPLESCGLVFGRIRELAKHRRRRHQLVNHRPEDAQRVTVHKQKGYVHNTTKRKKAVTSKSRTKSTSSAIKLEDSSTDEMDS